MSTCSSHGLRCLHYVVDRLLELTNKPVQSKVYTLSLAEHFRFLKRLFDDPNFSEILLPSQSAMTVTLPADTDMTGKLPIILSSITFHFFLLHFITAIIPF